MPVDKRQIVILAVVLAISLSGLFLAVSWSISRQPVDIDDSWYIVANIDDEYDSYTTDLLVDEYDCHVWDIAVDHDYNAFQRNLLIVGGSDYLSEQAPWIRALVIIEPDEQADAGFYLEDGVWKLKSPKYIYDLDTGDNNYGLITVGYDVELMRRIITIIGYDHFCTQLGARLLMNPPAGSDPLDYEYLVYRCVSHPTDFEAESPWTYEIDDKG